MILLIAFLTFFSFLGWNVLRKIFYITDRWFLLGGAPIIGMSAYVIIANGLAYIFGTPNAFPIALFISILLCVCLIVRRTKYPISADTLTRKQRNILLLCIAIIGYVYAAIYLYSSEYDEGFHLPLAQTIMHGNFPVKSLYFSDQFAQYHYGYDLLTAALTHFSGIPVWWTSDAILALCITSTFLISYSLFFLLTNHYGASLLSAFLFFFGGGLNYINAFLKNNAQSEMFWDWLKGLLTGFLRQKEFTMGYFHPSSMSSFGDGGSYHHPTAFSIPVVLILFYFFIKEERKEITKIQLFLTGILLGYIALISEHLFILICLTWFIWKLVITFSNKNRKVFIDALISMSIVFLPALLLALFQGGVITDAILHTTGHIQPSSFGIRDVPGITGFGGFHPLNKFSSWVFFFQEWGIPLILAPFTLYLLFKWSEKEKFYKYFFIFILISVPLPIFIRFISDADIIRISFLGYVFLASLLGIVFFKFLDHGKYFSYGVRKRIIITTVVLMSFSPIMFNLRILPLGIIIRKPLYSEAEYTIASDVKKIISLKKGVFTTNSQKVGILWGVQTPTLGDYPIWNFDRQYIKERFSFEKLKEKSFDFVYYDREMKYVLNITEADFVKNGWKKIYEYHDDDTDSILFQALTN